MIEAFVPSASTYAGDIDFLVNLIFWIVGFWFVLSELVFFYLIFRFRKREGEPGQYVTGEEKSQKRWITDSSYPRSDMRPGHSRACDQGLVRHQAGPSARAGAGS